MNGNLYEERGEDRRIRKSKKALQEALIRLLSKKSIGEITIKELTDEADGVCLAVRDDGVGMSAEEQERMWDRFWRADSSRHSEGTGLGLAIARWIIDRHGAQAQVESEPGKGTEMRVLFPRK